MSLHFGEQENFKVKKLILEYRQVSTLIDIAACFLKEQGQQDAVQSSSEKNLSVLRDALGLDEVRANKSSEQDTSRKRAALDALSSPKGYASLQDILSAVQSKLKTA